MQLALHEGGLIPTANIHKKRGWLQTSLRLLRQGGRGGGGDDGAAMQVALGTHGLGRSATPHTPWPHGLPCSACWRSKRTFVPPEHQLPER